MSFGTFIADIRAMMKSRSILSQSTSVWKRMSSRGIIFNLILLYDCCSTSLHKKEGPYKIVNKGFKKL